MTENNTKKEPEADEQSRTSTWENIIKSLRSLYSAGVKIMLGLSLAFVIIQALIQAFEDKVVLEPFLVPEDLSSQGYTGMTLVQMISDKIDLIREKVRKSDQQNFIEITAMNDQGPEIQVPGTDFTLKDVTGFIRIFVGTEIQSVTGNVTISQDQESIALTVRITGRPSATFKGGLEDFDSLIEPAAEYILKNLDPFTLGKYYFIEKDTRTMGELAHYIYENRPLLKDKGIAHLIDGLSLFSQKDYQGALDEWEMAGKKDPENIDALVYQGWALDEMGQFDKAIEKYEKVIKIDPENAAAYNNLGITLYKTERLQEAAAKFRILTERVPDYPHAYNNLGYLLCELGRYKEGIAYIKEAINLDSKVPDFYDSLGRNFFALGKYEDAIDQFRLVLKLKPNHEEAYCYWGKALDKLGRHEEAIEKYNQAGECISAEK